MLSSCMICVVIVWLCWCMCCRLQKLLQSIMVESQNKTLIFVETKRKADELQRRMQRDGLV